MTEQELEIIKNNMFIERHEELEDAVIEAVEKQIPLKPIETVKIEPVIAENGAYVDADTYVLLLCPLCGERVGLDDLCDKFCRECGQAIDWSGEVEE